MVEVVDQGLQRVERPYVERSAEQVARLAAEADALQLADRRHQGVFGEGERVVARGDHLLRHVLVQLGISFLEGFGQLGVRVEHLQHRLAQAGGDGRRLDTDVPQGGCRAHQLLRADVVALGSLCGVADDGAQILALQLGQVEGLGQQVGGAAVADLGEDVLERGQQVGGLLQ